jgi:hypothetical protein
MPLYRNTQDNATLYVSGTYQVMTMDTGLKLITAPGGFNRFKNGYLCGFRCRAPFDTSKWIPIEVAE